MEVGLSISLARGGCISAIFNKKQRIFAKNAYFDVEVIPVYSYSIHYVKERYHSSNQIIDLSSDLNTNPDYHSYYQIREPYLNSSKMLRMHRDNPAFKNENEIECVVTQPVCFSQREILLIQ